MKFIDLQAQYQAHKSAIDAALMDVIESGHFILGAKVKELEEQLAHYAGVKHCIGTSSGTDSLILALLAQGVGPGDEVITVPFTWISTVEAICTVGATPVFVDIDPQTYCLDVAQLGKAMTEKTKAILPVSLFGQLSDHQGIEEVIGSRDIAVIEDGAQSFGASHHGALSGSVGTMGITSFFPTKPLGGYGDAGAVFTNDTALAEELCALRVHGQKQRHCHERVARNARLDTIQAAIILAKLPVFDQEVARRQELAARYDEALTGLYETPKLGKGNTHVYAVYTIRTPQRDELQESLNAKNIPSAIYYPTPAHLQPAYRQFGQGEGSLPEAERACNEVLSLPLHPYLNQEDQDYIIEALQMLAKQPEGALGG